jgi:hypothetical protein
MDAPYTQDLATFKYIIKIQDEIVGLAEPGDIFFSLLDIDDPDDYNVAYTDINTTTGRCWLLTDEVNPLHEKFATEAKFACLGPGVWLRESVIMIDA